jgi:hypothetical protein
VEQPAIDLAKEQRATRARPRYEYSSLAKTFFASMDLLAGAQTALYKVKLIEALAPVPYRAWESHEHHVLARQADEEARAIMEWARRAADNEYRHLRVVTEKIREDAAKKPFYQTEPLPTLMVESYEGMSWVAARVGLRRAFLLNAEFEDHAEHTYAELVDAHPEWEEQPVTSEVVREYGAFASWADVFRRIGLDERDHMNASFRFAGRPELIVEYEGMPVG